MFTFETAINLHTRYISREARRTVFIRKYFNKRGHRAPKYSWLDLYKAIQDFKMIFQLSYDLRSGLLKPKYIVSNLRWFNQMRFLQLYLKFLRRIKWYELPLRRLFFYLNKAKRLCYLGLVQQANR